MTRNSFNYIYVFLTIALTVYGQIVLKWRVDKISTLEDRNIAKIQFYIQILLDPVVISGFAAAFIASLAWMAALTKFPLNHIYPITSLSFVLVAGLSWYFFGEALTPAKLIGLALIVTGIVVASS